MIELCVKVVIAYLLGGVMGGDLMRRLFGGGDLRAAGSGNVGTTNALRTRGPKFALGVLLIDASKGVVAALAIPAIPWPWPGAAAFPDGTLGYACGFVAAIGHCYPLLQKFRGGKAVATAAGVFGALLPWALPWMLLVFALTILISGYVGLASILAAATSLVWIGVAGSESGLISAAGIFALTMTLLIVFKHRSNIANIMAGREHRFEKARLIGRQFDRWSKR